MSVTALSPGPIFTTSGVNRKSTPVKLDATSSQIKETFKRCTFSKNKKSWPGSSPLAGLYDIDYTSTKLVLLNQNNRPKSSKNRLRAESPRVQPGVVPTSRRLLAIPMRDGAEVKHAQSCPAPLVPKPVLASSSSPRQHTDALELHAKMPAHAPNSHPITSQYAHQKSNHAPSPNGVTMNFKDKSSANRDSSRTPLHRKRQKKIRVSSAASTPSQHCYEGLNSGDKLYMKSISSVYDVTYLKELKQLQYIHTLMKQKNLGMHSASEYRSYLRYFENPRKRQFGEKEGTSRPAQHSTQRTPLRTSQRTPHRPSSKKTHRVTDQCDSSRQTSRRTETPDPRRFESSPRPLSHRLFSYQQQRRGKTTATTPATSENGRIRIVPDHSMLYRDSIAEEALVESSDQDKVNARTGGGDEEGIISSDADGTDNGGGVGEGEASDVWDDQALSGDSGVDVNHVTGSYGIEHQQQQQQQLGEGQQELRTASETQAKTLSSNRIDNFDDGDGMNEFAAKSAAVSGNADVGKEETGIGGVGRSEWSSCEENDRLLDQLSEDTVQVALTKIVASPQTSSNVNEDVYEEVSFANIRQSTNKDVSGDSHELLRTDGKPETVGGVDLGYTNPGLTEQGEDAQYANNQQRSSTESDEQRLKKIRKALPSHRRTRRYSSGSSSSVCHVISTPPIVDDGVESKTAELPLPPPTSDLATNASPGVTTPYLANQSIRSARRARKKDRRNVEDADTAPTAAMVAQHNRSRDQQTSDSESTTPASQLDLRDLHAQEELSRAPSRLQTTVRSNTPVRRRGSSIRHSISSQSTASRSRSLDRSLSDEAIAEDRYVRSSNSSASVVRSTAESDQVSSSSSKHYSANNSTSRRHTRDHAHRDFADSSSSCDDSSDAEDGSLWVRGLGDSCGEEGSADRSITGYNDAANTLSTAGSVHSSDEDLDEYDVPSYHDYGDVQGQTVYDADSIDSESRNFRSRPLISNADRGISCSDSTIDDNLERDISGHRTTRVTETGQIKSRPKSSKPMPSNSNDSPVVTESENDAFDDSNNPSIPSTNHWINHMPTNQRPSSSVGERPHPGKVLLHQEGSNRPRSRIGRRTSTDS